MRHLCSVCLIELGLMTKGNGISHGLCRLHELKSLEQEGILTPREVAELALMQTEHLKEAA